MFNDFGQSQPGEYWSRNKTCAALAIAFAVLSWCVAACSYAAAEEHGGQPEYRQTFIVGRYALYETAARMAVEGIAQLPNAHLVCGHVIQDRSWFIAMMFGLEAIPVGVWFLLRRVERELEKPRRRMR